MTPQEDAPLFPRRLREEQRAEVRQAIESSFPALPDQKEFADALCDVAEDFAISLDCLRFWLNDKPTGKVHSLHQWRIWCARYDHARSQLPPEAVDPPQAPPAPQNAPEPQQPANIPRRCRYCYEPTIQQIDSRRWCPRCGEVQL
jgi:hypothetical protein